MALVLYLLVTASLAEFLRRLVPLLIRWRQAMVLIALPFVFTGAALVTNRTYAPLDLLYTSEPFATARPGVEVRNSVLTDVSHQIVPWNLGVRDSVRAGAWPVWNRLMLAGDVLAAAGQPAPYYPVNVVAWLLPLAHALTFAAAMGYFIAGLGAFLFFRKIGLSELPSLFGAAAWMYATPVVFYLEWPLGTSLALLPLVLFGAEWLLEDAVPGAIALTVALVLLILAGHPESVVHIVGSAAVYALIRLVMKRRWDARTITLGVCAGLAALVLTAVYLLPIQDALPQTVQYTFRREVFARMDRSVPWPEAGALAVRTLVPFAYGRLVHDVADGAPIRYWLSDNGYAGSIVLALALFALARSRRRERWLFLGLAIFGLLAGSDAPLVSELLAGLPLFDIALNERLIVLCAFGLVALAALGMEALDRTFGYFALATLVVSAIAVALLWPSMRAANLQRDLLWPNAAFLLVPLAIAPFFRSRPAVILGLLLAQRYLEMGDFWPAVDPALASPPLPLARQLPRVGEPYRVVGLGDALPPNGSAYLGLEDVRGYQAMNLTFFHETYGLWCQAPAVGANRVDDLKAPFLSMMNVRYAFAGREATLPAGWNVIGREGGYLIAENSRVLGRAFIPKTVICGEDALPAMTTETDFSARAWLRGDCGATPFTNGAGSVTTTTRTPAHLTLSVKTDAPSWVVVTESAWRGWRAVDASGRRLALRRANHAFLAFQVPAGDSRVELIYRPRAFVIGAWISGVGLLAMLGGATAFRLSKYRQPEGRRSTPESRRSTIE